MENCSRYTGYNLLLCLSKPFQFLFAYLLNILQQANAEFDKGEPLYITLTEVHKEAVDDEILVDKKAVDFGKQMDGLVTRHDELKKRLEDKKIE